MSAPVKHSPLARFLGAMAALDSAPAIARAHADMLEHAREWLGLRDPTEDEGHTDMTRALLTMDALEYHLEGKYPDADDELIQSVIFEAMGS